MAKVVVMPKLGLTMTEGTIGSWYKQEGDQVSTGEKLFTVETDKLTNDIESNTAGVLRRILRPAGDTIPCNGPVAIIAAADEDIGALMARSEGAGAPADTDDAAAGASASAAAPAPARTAEKPAPGGRIIAAPAAKKLAAEHGIELSEVTGTGPKGRITIKDVEAYLSAAKDAAGAPGADRPKASPMAAKTAAAAGIDLADVPADGRIMQADVDKYAAGQKAGAESGSAAAAQREERIPMSGMRKVIARRMSESWALPAVTIDISVDARGLISLRSSLKETIKISYTDMLVKIAAAVLLEHPLVNCSIDGDEIILHHYVNIGVAVALDDGLLVPVIRDVQEKGLAEISGEIKDLAEAARGGSLSPDDLQGGTFTITNLGMYGVEAFSPIINLPEAAILGVSTIKEELVMENGQVTAVPYLKLSLTTDHRAVDGAVAAQFLKRLKQLLENPALLLL